MANWIEATLNTGPNSGMFVSPFSFAGPKTPSTNWFDMMAPVREPSSGFIYSNSTCSKCNEYANCLKSHHNADKSICSKCLMTFIFPKEETKTTNCMICMKNETDKNVLKWEKDDNKMTMCLNCVFDFILMKKAKEDFKSQVASIDKNEEEQSPSTSDTTIEDTKELNQNLLIQMPDITN